MTHYKNEVTKLPDQYKDNTTHDGTTVGRIKGSRFLAEGLSYYEWYMPTFAGVNPENGNSMWYYYTPNNIMDPENPEVVLHEKGSRITTEDYSTASSYGKELQGDATPDLYGGFNTSFNFYGVDISANFTYQIGGMAYDSGYAALMDSPSQTSVGFAYHRDLWNAWTPENPNSKIPRFVYNGYNDKYFSSSSSRFLVDASYLNIQNITIGYTLPAKITRKFLVEKLRIYFTCDNVWYWSRRKGLDPRQSLGGSTNPYEYAPIRTFSGGVTITF
jgi:hypothetical protein